MPVRAGVGRSAAHTRWRGRGISVRWRRPRADRGLEVPPSPCCGRGAGHADGSQAAAPARRCRHVGADQQPPCPRTRVRPGGGHRPRRGQATGRHLRPPAVSSPRRPADRKVAVGAAGRSGVSSPSASEGARGAVRRRRRHHRRHAPDRRRSAARRRRGAGGTRCGRQHPATTAGRLSTRMGILDRILRAGEGKKLKALEGLVPDINARAAEMSALSDDALRAKTAEFRGRIERGETLEDLLIESFAVVREAADRVIGQRHFDVQLMGGAALHFGWVAEMKTGEGKTLVSTLPAYLNGVGGKGVHLITVNDYLARFHAEWMARLHKFLGLTVGVVIPGEEDPDWKRAQYACDITYGTNNEFGFDYLRDNMVSQKDQQTQRGHNYAIVDEVDSILIDEARTPLIISGRASDAHELYYQFARISKGLQRERDYEVDEVKRTVVPTEDGIGRVEDALGVDNLYEHVNQNYVHQLQVAL